MTADLFRDGWRVFGPDDRLARWLDTSIDVARATLTDPAHAEWHRYQDTWFAGVNALPNDENGEVAGGAPLAGDVIDFIDETLGFKAGRNGFRWDKAQVSVCYPGYPQAMEGETEGLLRYRRNRDAAHVDGLRRHGPDRRRTLEEFHAFILGIPMAEVGPGASPFVVWRGSHELMRAAFRARFAGIPPENWTHEDITEAYHAARRSAFETCERVEVHARPGESYLVHRLALHGMAKWEDGAEAGPDGRMIVYFRPEIGGPVEWLEAP